MSYCRKCYVDSKKAGIIEENGVYFMGSFVTAWNDGTAPVGNRFGFLKFSRLNAGNYTDSVAEIENRFGKVAEEGTTEFAEIRDAAAVRVRSGKERIIFSVKVKDPGQYLDIRKLAYVLVNPSFLRRHFFRLAETDPDLTQSYWNIGYGFVLDDSEMKDIIKGIPSLKDSKYLSFEMIKGRNSEAIQKMII